MAESVHGELAGRLGRCDLFAGLSEESRRMLAAVCGVVQLRKRQVLFSEGQKGQSAYFLLTGAVQLIKTSPAGREVVIRTVQPDELFAEIVLLEGDRYPVTAVALRASRLCRIPGAAFRELLSQPGFRNEFLASVLRRLRYLVDRILYLTAYDVEERFFRFLLEQYGQKSQYELPLSKKDLAAAIAATPETLSRMILRLTAAKKIQWQGRTLRVSADAWKKSGVIGQ